VPVLKKVLVGSKVTICQLVNIGQGKTQPAARGSFENPKKSEDKGHVFFFSTHPSFLPSFFQLPPPLPPLTWILMTSPALEASGVSQISSFFERKADLNVLSLSLF